MHHIISIRRALICIFRFSLVFYFALSIGCEGGRCTRKQNKKLLLSSRQTLLGRQVFLENNNTIQEDNGPAAVDTANLDCSNDPEAPIKALQTLERLAKVKEQQQVIVLLHGLHRVAYDFHLMITTLKRKFPHALIIALESVAKDFSKKRGFTPSPTMKLSILQQAELAYNEIKKKVPYGSHVIIVGHSQGGLRALATIKEYGKRLYSECGIVIDRLITIGTPWKGAPVMNYIKNIKDFKEKFDKIAVTLNRIQKNYSKAVRGYFFKFMPGLANAWPWLYQKVVPHVMGNKYLGAADLDPESDFIRSYIPSSLKEVDLPITAIAGLLTDFSKLFEPFPSSIGSHNLAELNATYAELIGGGQRCEHDMLLPVATQHAEGLVTKNFERIKVYGACHGNKVGISVKRGLSELNNKQVIQKVVESIEETFYEHKEGIATGEGAAQPAA